MDLLELQYRTIVRNSSCESARHLWNDNPIEITIHHWYRALTVALNPCALATEKDKVDAVLTKWELDDVRIDFW